LKQWHLRHQKITNILEFDKGIYFVSQQKTYFQQPLYKLPMCVHITHDLVILEFPALHNIDWWHRNTQGFLKHNHLINKHNLQRCFQFSMGKPNIKACLMPFVAPFGWLFSWCNYFLQHRLNGLQVNLPKTNKKFNIITSILACFGGSTTKAQPLPKNYKSQRTTIDNWSKSLCKGT
jgi:hypothetical protein